MSKRCVKCGAILDDIAKFCEECGEKISEPQEKTKELFCNNCGKQLKPDSMFCTECGKKLEIDGKTDKFQLFFKILYTKEFREAILFIGVFFLFMFPDILKAKEVMTSKAGISSTISNRYDILGGLLGAICISLFFLLANNVKFTKDNSIILLSRVLKASCWILAMYTAISFVQEWIEEKWLWKIDNYKVYVIIYIAIIVVICMILNACLYWSSAILSNKKTKNLLNSFLVMLTKPKLMISTLFILMVVIFSQEGLLWGLGFLPLNIKYSFSGIIFTQFLCLIVQALLVKILFNGFIKKNNLIKVIGKNTYVGSFISAAVAIVIFIAITVGISSKNSIDNIEEVVTNDLNKMYSMGAMRLADGDIDGALECFKTLKSHASAWECVANEEDVEDISFDELLNGNLSDESVLYISMLFDEDISEMEQYVLTTADDTIWYYALLNKYKNLENDNKDALTEKQKDIQKELLLLCIMAQNYTDNTVKLKDIVDKKESITKIADNYIEVSKCYDVLEPIAEIGHSGKLGSSEIGEFLSMAEENPDNIIYQYAAYILGSNYVEDDVPHLEKTVEAAKRFDKLFSELENIDKQGIIDEKINVAEAIFNCKDYESAISYYDKAIEAGGGVENYEHLAECYDRVDKPEKCLEYAKKAIDSGSNDYYTLYLAALGSLKSKDIDGSLKYVIQLSNLAKEATNEKEKYEIESTLFMYLQYLTIDEETSWTDFSYFIYEELSKSQLDTIGSNELLDNYSKAMFYTFQSIDYTEALKYVDKVIKIDDKLSQIYYLKGCIYFGQEDFKNAKTWFLKSIDVYEEQATVWYSLGRTYDALEEYQNSYDACNKVEAILKYNNHENDLYGVQLHAVWLKDELKEELGMEDEE